MKNFLPTFLLLALCALTASADMSPDNIVLTGIIVLPEYKCATFVVRDNNSWPQISTLTMKEGTRQGPIEILEIKPANGTAKLKVNDAELNLRLVSGGTSSSNVIEVENLGLDALLPIYAELSGRTVLRAALPEVRFTFKAPASNYVQAASALTNALKEQGIWVILDGEKFAMVVPEAMRSMAVPRSAGIKSSGLKPPPANGSSSVWAELIPPGGIVLNSVSLEQVLPMYVELKRAKGVEHDATFLQLAPVSISLKTQTQLNREEAVYAFDTVFALNGFKVVPSTNGMVKVVGIQHP